ncbi:hypothetical protein SBBP2_3010001 [Burkholderiales bacterium]|nr:hypothetical protein SBBP2_3010001 [Burkholderiales bacterium]
MAGFGLHYGQCPKQAFRASALARAPRGRTDLSPFRITWELSVVDGNSDLSCYDFRDGPEDGGARVSPRIRWVTGSLPDKLRGCPAGVLFCRK